MHQTRSHKPIHAALAGTLAALAAFLATPEAAAQDAGRQVDFNIPAQPLAPALAAFAQQAGIRVEHDGAFPERQAPAINGRHDVDEALGELLAGSGLAYRHTAPDAVAIAAAAHDAPAATLGEIIVTAQKREQSAQKIGIAVTALGKDAIAAIGRQDVTALAGQVPNLEVNQYSPTITVFNIRGVSQNDFTDAQEAPIAFYDDEVYIASLGAITGMNCVVELVPPRTLPRTSSGKLSRAKAKKLYLAGEIEPYAIAA